MKILSLLMLLVLTSFTSHAKQEGALDEGMVNPGYHEKPSWFKNSFLDLNEDIAEASAAGKKLIVYFYQDGCPYCKKLLDDNFSQKSIADKIKTNFDLVAVNMWGDNELVFQDKTYTEKSFAEAAKVMYTPTILFFDEAANTVFRMNGYYQPGKFDVVLDYVRSNIFKDKKFSEYLSSVVPIEASGELHQSLTNIKAPFDFSKLTNNKPLLVMFEQKQCPSCDELHNDVLARDESKKLLKAYNIAVLDMWTDDLITTPEGKKTTASAWAKTLNIQYAPSFVFFDEKSKEVFRIDGYLKAFHVQSVLDYVAQKAYNVQSNFQRWIDERAHHLREKGVTVDLMD